MAKHSAVESYTVVMLLTFILIIVSRPSLFHHPLTLSFQTENLPFLQIPHRSLPFFFRTDYTDSPDCLLLLLSISVFFLLFSFFSVFTFFSCRFRAVD